MTGGTYEDRRHRYVIVTDVTDDGSGKRFDVEYVESGAVTKYRPNLPAKTADDLASLEGWRSVA